MYLNLILQQVRNDASSLFDPNAVSLKDLFGLHIVHHVLVLSCTDKLCNILLTIMLHVTFVCVVFQFEYTLTCAVCTKPHDKELRILKRVSQVSTV